MESDLLQKLRRYDLVPWALSCSHRGTMGIIVATMERVSGANLLFALFLTFSCILVFFCK
jgi:hypothetical protein